MIAKTIQKSNFVGAKAIFDENFLPPKLLFRKKEENTLLSLLNDSIVDNFSLNIMVQGTQGIGKKAIVNKVLNDLINQNQDFKALKKINIDCKEKKVDELLFTLISQTKEVLNLNIDLSLILNSKISYLWNLLKLIYGKLKNEYLLVFNNAEYLEPRFLNKLLFLGKDVNITSIYTLNKVLNPSTLEVFSKFDFKNKLNYYTFNQLYQILQQRISLVFSHEIDDELIQYIVDLIFEHHVPVPGKGIEILRDLYPFLQKSDVLGQTEILEICQNNFETLGMTDEFNMVNYLSEENILTIIFLDNLANYFLTNSTKFYIKLKDLYELYELSCESLIYEKDRSEFNGMLEMINGIGILSKARKLHHVHGYSSEKNPDLNNYFMGISPNRLKIMVDTIFSNSPV